MPAKNESPPTDGAADKPERTEAERLADELLAKRTPPTGAKLALEKFRAIDEDAQIVWRTSGPRGSSTEQFVGILTERPGAGRGIVIVQEFASGRFKLFVEAPNLMDLVSDLIDAAG